jgi:hypothetical protein
MAVTTSVSRYYRANRGGHAPGHLRDALIECLEQWTSGEVQDWADALMEEETISFFDGQFQKHWNELPARERGRWLAGQLWNCSDTLPGDLRREFEVEHGTYAGLVRKLWKERRE